MACKSTLLFASLLLVIGLAAPLAEAQFQPLLGLSRIQGIVFCTIDGNAGVNGANATSVFPNAVVQLVRGTTVVANATTNASGIFSVVLNAPISDTLALLQNAAIVIRTPLVTCNASLVVPVGGVLSAPLQLIRTVLDPLLNLNLAEITIGRFSITV